MSPKASEKQTLNVKIDRSALVRELAYVCRCVPANPTLPVLGCVHLSVEGDTLNLKTSNMDLTLTTCIDAQVTDSGAVCVSAKRLAKILGEMTDVTVALIATDKDEVEVIGAACKFRLMGLPEDDFPPLAVTKAHPIAVKGAVLSDAVAPVLHAVSTDETRFILCSVFLQLDAKGEVHAVATDGRRLAKCGGIVEPDAVSGVVPTEAAKLLVTLAEAEEVEILLGSQNITVRSEGRSLVSKLVEGNYPNFKQVIPTNIPHAVEMEAGTLKAALHRVALVANDTVSMEFSKGRLTLKGALADVGSGAESLTLASCPQETITIAFDPAYVIQALAACGDTAVLGLNDGLSPMVVSADRFLAVVMPKRVS